jgi:hypothetical protein
VTLHSEGLCVFAMAIARRGTQLPFQRQGTESAEVFTD